ncbi:ATP-binding cassette subfamily C member 4-like [Diabrotica undecimpunctata]|uniref:ATP-binding cassette subfamily C member 4-like n=1 Tax=Diabrotica undecimpunctata TaxID=50387 RepID=UPI003B640B8A
MDSTKKYVKNSPEEKANFLSKIFLWWFLPFFKYGYKNDVQLKDIYNATKPDMSESLGDQLQKNWEEQIKKCDQSQNKNKPSLKSAIVKTYLTMYTASGVMIFLQFIVIRMLQPIVLAEYINFFDKKHGIKPNEVGWLLASGVVIMAFLNVILLHNTFLNTQRVGMRVRIAVGSLLYRKLLKLNHTSLGKTAAGQLVNLLSNDLQRFDYAAVFLHYIWVMPINSAISFYIMYRTCNLVAALTGMGAVILEALPLQSYLSRLQGQLRGKIAVRTDTRIKLMSEITSGIQVIKMYAWEKPFEKVVELARRLEIDSITKSSYIHGMLSSMSVFTERFALFIVVITFVLMEGRISGDIVFSMAQLVNTVQLIFAMFFPRALSTYAEAKVSIKRIEEFLLLEETAPKKKLGEKGTLAGKPGEIELFNATASWSENPIVPTLVDLNLHLTPGTLCCVVGNVGAGKSSTLHLLLKELSPTNGKVNVFGNVAYASQEPWLFVSNVRENILFGRPYDKKRYQDVIRVCSLERDLKELPHGDKTLVGERGAALSGGQKARVNLARAVYSEADIYLFDDPLSAVDTKVGRHLFDECIVKYLKNKTRILVTHQLQYMKKADIIVILNNGRIEKAANFSALSQDELNVLQQEPEPEENEKEVKKERSKLERSESAVSEKSLRLDHYQSNTSLTVSEEPEDKSNEREEEVEQGTVPLSTFVEYFRSGAGVFFLTVTATAFIFAQAFTNITDLWLTHWTNIEGKHYADMLAKNVENISEVNSNNLTNAVNTLLPLLTSAAPVLSTLPTLPTNISVMESLPTISSAIDTTTVRIEAEETFDQKTYIIIYTILMFSSMILLTLRSFLYFIVCMSSSRALHNKMFSNILQAPMRFFDTNPSGRILNRFSKDMGAIDEMLPKTGIDTIQIFTVLVGVLVLVFIVTPLMIIPTILIGILFYYCRNVYLASAQSIKRWEGVAKAPVFSHVSATLQGISTIRASNSEQMVIKEFDVLQDQHTGTYVCFLVSSTAFGLYLDIISTMFLALLTYQFLIFSSDSTAGGNVGLVLSQSLILTGMLQYGVRQTAEAISNMISVERVLQYTKLEKEGPFESLTKPPRDWPEKGKIVFKNTFLRYSLDVPPALKNLNIEVNSGEKVGIVGRTGAGKSTLIASLFRLAPIEGTISIDNLNTADIGLKDLRLNVSIIPQEPILFSESVRYNLDPFEKYSDEILWKAIENVELKHVITDLNQTVSEGGSNFSAGQRQLLCLARAIVRNNKVLVMDEATANVDPGTDALIQKTIRERFKDCTVLTIAHRLNTVMDSDRVLVMDAGEAVEFDHPYTLLQNPNGYFSRMLKETGPAMEEMLKAVAEGDYNKKHGGKLEIKLVEEKKDE